MAMKDIHAAKRGDDGSYAGTDHAGGKKVRGNNDTVEGAGVRSLVLPAVWSLLPGTPAEHL